MYSAEIESTSAELDYPIHRKTAEITITPLRNSRASRQLPDSIVRFSQPSMNGRCKHIILYLYLYNTDYKYTFSRTRSNTGAECRPRIC